MTTFQTKKDPLPRGVSPAPSKIPVRSKRLPPVKPCDLEQENQDPKRLEQFSVHRPLVDSAGPMPKATHQTQKSERLVGSTPLRNPLEELRPSPQRQNVGSGPPPQKEIPGAIEFVADPEALATILSGEGVKTCRLGRQPSLAQRVLVRGSQGGTIRRGQGARASTYLAPRTPQNRLDPARASCFSRLEGPGPRSCTLSTQKVEAVIPPSKPFFHSSARPSFQELRRETGGSSRTAVSQASGLHLVSGPSPFGLAQRVPSPGFSAPPSYSVLRRLAIRPKTQFTPIPSAPKAQQAQSLSGFSPQSCPEEPALPWEQIAVRLFDQESYKRLQEGLGQPPVATPHGPHPSRTPSLQELKMQRISVLKQLLQQEVEGLAGSKCAPLHGSSSLDMVELQSLLAEIPRTLNAPEHNSGAFYPPELLQNSGLPKPCFQGKCGEPQLCPGTEPEAAQPCPPAEQGPPEPCLRREPAIPEPATQKRPVGSEPCPPIEPGPLQACSQGQAGLPEPPHRVEPGASEACSLEPRSAESSPQPCCGQWAPVTTSVISQHPVCASPPIHSLQSLRPPTGQAGPSSLAPRTLALRQRLKACLTAIHCFHEARLDDECAFYTSRAPPSGPPRVCTNPVATLLERQDALCFIPIGSAATLDSPT